MCGRYSLLTVHMVFGDGHVARFQRWQNRYNVAPSTDRVETWVPIFRLNQDQYELSLARWGFMKRDPKGLRPKRTPIIARSETIHSNWVWRDSFRKRRCLIPATAYYEWVKRDDGLKYPFCIRPKSEEGMMLAGLWDEWESSETGEVIESCTIVTTEANDDVRRIHKRMPAILAPADAKAWLDPSLGEDPLKGMLRPAPLGLLKNHEVSRKLNYAGNEGAYLMEPMPS